MWGRYNPRRIKDWKSAKLFFDKARDPNAGRPLENNTRLYRAHDGVGTAYIVRFHDTDIVTYRANGDVVIRTGGWNTVTTKSRICEYAPIYWISTCKGVWYLRWNNRTYVFEDCILPKDGRSRPRLLRPARGGGNGKYLITVEEEARERLARRRAAELLPRAARLLLKYGMMCELGQKMVHQLESSWNEAYRAALGHIRWSQEELERQKAHLGDEEARLTKLREEAIAAEKAAIAAEKAADVARKRLMAAEIEKRHEDELAAEARRPMENLHGKQMRPIRLDRTLDYVDRRTSETQATVREHDDGGAAPCSAEEGETGGRERVQDPVDGDRQLART